MLTMLVVVAMILRDGDVVKRELVISLSILRE